MVRIQNSSPGAVFLDRRSIARGTRVRLLSVKNDTLAVTLGLTDEVGGGILMTGRIPALVLTGSSVE